LVNYLVNADHSAVSKEVIVLSEECGDRFSLGASVHLAVEHVCDPPLLHEIFRQGDGIPGFDEERGAVQGAITLLFNVWFNV
jgi:hypothetical protein